MAETLLRRNITIVDLLAVAKTVTIKKAAVIIEEVKTAVGNWVGYAAQTKVEERLWKGITSQQRLPTGRC